MVVSVRNKIADRPRFERFELSVVGRKTFENKHLNLVTWRSFLYLSSLIF